MPEVPYYLGRPAHVWIAAMSRRRAARATPAKTPAAHPATAPALNRSRDRAGGDAADPARLGL